MQSIFQQLVENLNRGIQYIQGILQDIWNFLLMLPEFMVSWFWTEATKTTLWIANLFPDSSPVSDVISDAGDALGYFAQYFVIANYFINLPAVGFCLLFFIAFEAVSIIIWLIKLVWAVLPVA